MTGVLKARLLHQSWGSPRQPAIPQTRLAYSTESKGQSVANHWLTESQTTRPISDRLSLTQERTWASCSPWAG